MVAMLQHWGVEVALRVWGMRAGGQVHRCTLTSLLMLSFGAPVRTPCHTPHAPCPMPHAPHTSACLHSPMAQALKLGLLCIAIYCMFGTRLLSFPAAQLPQPSSAMPPPPCPMPHAPYPSPHAPLRAPCPLSLTACSIPHTLCSVPDTPRRMPPMPHHPYGSSCMA